MKTSVPFKQNLVKMILLICVIASGVPVKAQTVPVLTDGLKFVNPTLITAPATDLQVGAQYLFSKVTTGVDAVVTIDSLINGAEVNKIDDNSSGTGYLNAFQPAIKAGGNIGMSYAVFTIKFFAEGTSNSVSLQTVHATAVDMDGNNQLREFAKINTGAGALMNYLTTSIDIVVNLLPGNEYFGQNLLGIERTGIDTLSWANMFTTTNSNVSSFTVKYGSITTNTSQAVRQFSLYMKGFNYPFVGTLPVKLESFTAMLVNKRAELKWVTSSEINVSHFAVEKSTDGRTFTDAGMVFAYGSTSAKANYNFSDNLTVETANVVYYRLRSVDVDGKTDYSDTRILRLAKQTASGVSILTYPNPVTNELRITIPENWQNKNLVVEVFNANGTTAARKQAANSSQTETINVNALAPGFYIVRVNCNGEIAQQKIIKQ
jgi:hypothetical protein